MTESDRGRLALFFGVLVAAAAILIVVSRFADVSPITLAPAYMFSPLLAGLAVCRREGIPVADVGLRPGRPRWLAASAVAALPLVGVTLLLAVAVPGVGLDPPVDPIPGLDLPPGLVGVAATVALALATGATVNAVFAFGEEFGWRGYLLWELAPWGFWRASLAIGAAWGLWHAPVIVAGYNYPSFPIAGVGVMTVACVAFSPDVRQLLRDGSGGRRHRGSPSSRLPVWYHVLGIDWGFTSLRKDATLGDRRLTDTDESRRVPIRCTNCGSITVGRINPDGPNNPVGRAMACDCNDPDFRILAKDDRADEE